MHCNDCLRNRQLNWDLKEHSFKNQWYSYVEHKEFCAVISTKEQRDCIGYSSYAALYSR